MTSERVDDPSGNSGTVGHSRPPEIDDRDFPLSVVFASGQPVAQIDLASLRVVAASDPALRIFDARREEVIGRPVTEFIAEEPAGALPLLATGRLDGAEASRLLRRPDGRTVQAYVWVHVLGLSRPARFAAVFLTDQHPPATLDPDPVTSDSRVVGVVDTRWCIERISREVEFLLGLPVDHLRGVSLPSLLHPGDVPGLLTAAAHAHSYGVNAVARARLRRADGSLLWCRIRVAPLAQPPALAFVVSTLAEHARHGEDRARDMELLLARIAREALAAGLSLPSPRMPNRTDRAEFSRLSDREWQVVFRLAEGQRVSSIAADLAVTPSTVRNHLSSVFGKLGVGSQAELLAMLRSSSPG